MKFPPASSDSCAVTGGYIEILADRIIEVTEEEAHGAIAIGGAHIH
jgi:hypothetical protein